MCPELGAALQLTLAMLSRAAGFSPASCTAILIVKPRRVLILCNGLTLLIRVHFLIHNSHQILWAELLLSCLFTGH